MFQACRRQWGHHSFEVSEKDEEQTRRLSVQVTMVLVSGGSWGWFGSSEHKTASMARMSSRLPLYRSSEINTISVLYGRQRMTTNFIESWRLNWFHGVGIKVLGRLQGRICPRHSSSWSCQHPLAWGCMAPLPSLFRRAPFTSVYLAFCLDQISVYLSKNDTFRDFRPSMKIIPTKTHLKIVSKATFMDLKKWLSLRGGGSFSSLPMWAFTSYGCGAIPPGQTWCLKQEKLVLSQCWAGRCQNHVFLDWNAKSTHSPEAPEQSPPLSSHVPWLVAPSLL